MQGVTWCFACSEEGWVAHTINTDGSVTNGPSFDETIIAARGDALADLAIPAVGRINCNTGAEM